MNGKFITSHLRLHVAQDQLFNHVEFSIKICIAFGKKQSKFTQEDLLSDFSTFT